MVSNDEEVRLLYLLSSLDVLPASYHKLRSYLSIHMSNIADHHNFKLPKNLGKRNKTCPYCYTPWNNETTSFKMLPSKKYKVQTQSKILEEEANKSTSNELRNTLVLKCKVCTKKSLFSLIKKKPVREKKEKVTESRKKKKKKQDRACGLIVNLKQSNDIPSERIILKKKERTELTKQTKFVNPAYSLSSPEKLTPNFRRKPNTASDCKKIIPNPFAVQPHIKCKGKTDKKLERLKEAIKKNKNVTRKTLKDFLKLV